MNRVAASWRNGCAFGTQGSRSKQRADRDEGGFTLIELIVVVAVMPIMVGALSIGLVSILSLQSGVSGRLADSGDAQVVSVNFGNDVQSSVNLTTAATAQCGSGQQLLGLEWNPGVQLGNFQTVVSYVLVSNASGLTSSLIRQYCTGGSSTPTSSITMSSDVPNNQPAPTIAPPPSNTAAMSGWTPTVGVTSVTFPITGSATTYRYSEVAVPGESANSTFGIVTPPPTTCGFATIGTGTYASSLCFVDFSQYNPDQAAAPVCQPISQGITNTPFTMTFCLSVSGGPVAPASIPTYTNPPTSEAFLGNNGFYTGIPGNPALYQKTQGSTSTVTLTNINVLDANGKPATGWGIVTGDAESTDQNESMTWTSDKVLNLIPNSPSSLIGNACAAPDSPDGLIGVDSTTVQCAATVSSDKTGTVMLKAAAPTTLTVKMVGDGLEAMFIGLLLPGAAPS